MKVARCALLDLLRATRLGCAGCGRSGLGMLAIVGAGRGVAHRRAERSAGRLLLRRGRQWLQLLPAAAPPAATRTASSGRSTSGRSASRTRIRSSSMPSMLPIALFGLSEFSVRLTAALLRCAGGLRHRSARALRVRRRWRADSRALLLAVLPWHVHFSRIAFEAHRVSGVVSARLRRRWRPACAGGRAGCFAAGPLFALCLYAYGPAKLFVRRLLARRARWSMRAASVGECAVTSRLARASRACSPPRAGDHLRPRAIAIVRGSTSAAPRR